MVRSLGRIARLFVAVVGMAACEKAEPASFPCGTVMCHDDQVCASSYTEGSTSGAQLSCVPMPDACDVNPTCDCLTQLVCYGNLAPAQGAGPKCGCDDTGCYIDCVSP